MAYRCARTSLGATLEKQGVAPDAVELRNPLASADHTEAAPAVKLDACDVLRKDRGLDRPDSGGIRVGAKPRQERDPDTPAARALSTYTLPSTTPA